MLKHFKVVIEEESSGGYSVYVPAFPGCASQGETINEAVSNIKEAAKLYLWSLKDDGLPLPKADVNVVLKDIAVPV